MGSRWGVAGSLALRTMIDHPPCSILNLQHLAMASCRPGGANNAPLRAAARLKGALTLACSVHAAARSAVGGIVVRPLRGGGQHLADHLSRKATSSQEAQLPGAFAQVLCRGAEPALPQLVRAL